MGSDRFNAAGENGYGDRDVADCDQNGKDFGEELKPGRVDGMAEAQGLKHAPEAVIEVIAEHDHGDDIEEGDGPDLKTVDNVVVDVV